MKWYQRGLNLSEKIYMIFNTLLIILAAQRCKIALDEKLILRTQVLILNITLITSQLYQIWLVCCHLWIVLSSDGIKQYDTIARATEEVLYTKLNFCNNFDSLWSLLIKCGTYTLWLYMSFNIFMLMPLQLLVVHFTVIWWKFIFITNLIVSEILWRYQKYSRK